MATFTLCNSLHQEVCPYCGSIPGTDLVEPLKGNGSSATQKPQAQVTPPSMVVAESGRQICLPAIPLVYLGRRDEGQNIHPHIDFTQDDGAMQGVSRRHARIHQSYEGTYIEDIGSANGTFVNGQRLHPFRLYPLYHGDRLQLGQLKLEVAFSYEKTVA